MKGMKKLFALLAVLTMALTLTPMVAPVAAAEGLTVEINGGETGTVLYGTSPTSPSATALLAVTKISDGELTINPTNTGVTYQWYVYNENVATVSPTTASTTTLTAVAEGTTKVTVAVNFSGKTGYAEYTVEVKAGHVITIEPSQTGTVVVYTKDPGRQATLSAVVKLDSATVSNPTISWDASPAGAVAIYPASGYTSVTISADTTTPTTGTITITATAVAADGTVTTTTATRPFEVRDHQLALSVVPGTAILYPDGTQKLTLSAKFDGAALDVSNLEVTPTVASSTTNVIELKTVDKANYVVTAKNYGSATVTFTATYTPVAGTEVTDNATAVITVTTAPIVIYGLSLTDAAWKTENAWGIDLSGVSGTDYVLRVKGTLTGTTLDVANLSVKYGNDTVSYSVAPAGNDFYIYIPYSVLANYEEDRLLNVAYGTFASDSIPVNLFKITAKDTVLKEVTSGEEVTITGTVAPVQANTLTPSLYKVYVWKDGTTAPVTSTVISDTGTFSITFVTYGDKDQEYYVTVQKKADTAYNEAPYYIFTVTKLADVAVGVAPDTIVAGSANNITLQLKVGDVKLATHNVTGTVALGDKKVPFTGPTDSDGKIIVTGINFGNTGVADITVKVNGPNFYGIGSAKLVVSTSAEYLLNVQWPDTWKIGEKNTVTFISPVATNPVESVTVTVTGPVVEAGEALTGVASIKLTPMGYGTLTLKVEAKLQDGTKVSKTFTTTIPGYVATVEPVEIERGATTTLTVVVKDAYGNPVNNALVQFFSPVNSNDVIAKLDGTATTAVNNGTYKLLVKGSDIKDADEDAYVLVNNSAGKKQAYIPVEIMPSLDITIALDKSEIVLGPKTTLSATFTAPVDLIGSVVKVLDADEEDTRILNYIINKTGTVVALTLPIETMPEEAGTYQLVVANPNHKGTATLTFVEPVITASPAELLAGATTVVTFTSANVKDLTAVTKVTATGAISKITAKTGTGAITATVVTANAKGTGTVTFTFDSGYTFDMPISVVYGKLSVDNATITVGTKVLAFKPVDAAGATLKANTAVKINVLGNEYIGYVGTDGTVSVLIPELPVGTYTVVVKVDGYQDASFSLVVVEPAPPVTPTTVIELAPGMDVYTINGETKFWDATPYIKEGRTMVPIRHLAEALGFKADWDFSDPANKMVFIYTAEQDPEKDKEHPFILLIIGQPTAMVNGNLVALDVAPEILNGRTMVPLRFVVETLGYKVEWLGNTIRLMK